MSDTALFILIATDELTNNGQLPGDIRSLRNLTKGNERIVHVEVISEAPLPEKTATTLGNDGALLTILPASPDTTSALVGGLMARLHEFTSAYAQVSQFILAGSDSDRLVSAASFLQKAGYAVLVAGPDRKRLDACSYVSDDTAVWSGRQSKRDNSREDTTSALDPYEVLVEEVTRSREKGQRVLLTSLKQRMRRRMRRFDETRMKDLDGRPMRKFKDFISDAANRNLIQLIENGNRSQVLLPGEDTPEDSDDEETGNEESTPKKARNSRRKSEGTKDDNENDKEVDPLLDSVDMVESEEAEKKDLTDLTAEDFDVENINEDASAPPQEFVASLEKMIPETGWTLEEILNALAEKKAGNTLSESPREIQAMLQNSFYNELLEPVNEDNPKKYIIVDDWKGIIDFL